jgi:DNA-binding PadR family transcriptional regulator
MCKRKGKRWNTQEILRLQREYELLNISIDEIAKLHERTVYAILAKVEQEEFIDDSPERKEEIQKYYIN